MIPKTMQQIPLIAKTSAEQTEAELQIRDKQQVVDYDTKEYPVEVLVQKYADGLEDDQNEIFIPDYQREMAWSDKHQSKFVESVFLGLPIPYIFVADLGRTDDDDEPDLGRLEIVDGTQRIRTLYRFLHNQLTLSDLKKLDKLNGFRFCDLSLARQRRFQRSTIRMIVLTEKADETTRRDMFERINTGSIALNEMEKRRGISPGPMVALLEELAKDARFQKLCPLSESARRSREPEEFVLRFFAYLERYREFERQVNEFLNEYLEMQNKSDLNTQELRQQFSDMLEFVERYFPNGFSKKKGHSRTPRIRFEAISVGVALALKECPNLQPTSVDWLDSEEFKKHTTSDASNSRPKVIARIEYVRDQLLQK